MSERIPPPTAEDLAMSEIIGCSLLVIAGVGFLALALWMAFKSRSGDE